MQCDRCAGDEFTKAGRDRQGRQRYRCTRCGRRLMPRSMSVFSGYRFPDEVSALAVLYCAKIPSVGFHSSATTFGLIGTGRSFRILQAEIQRQVDAWAQTNVAQQ
jgi:transposase-like protein